MRNIFAALLMTTAVVAHANGLRVDTLDENKLHGFNCGLYLVDSANPNRGLVFFANTFFEGFAQLDGNKVQFAHVQTENKRKRDDNVTAGDNYKTTWDAPDYTLKLSMDVDTTCTGERRKCSEVKEHGTMTVGHGKSAANLKVEGYEGCLMEQRP
jgi:hypothetical protein